MSSDGEMIRKAYEHDNDIRNELINVPEKEIIFDRAWNDNYIKDAREEILVHGENEQNGIWFYAKRARSNIVFISRGLQMEFLHKEKELTWNRHLT